MFFTGILRAIYIAVLASFICPANLFAQFSGGSGTITDPYQISTLQQLQEVRTYPEMHFILINDIDAGETKSWNNGKGFIPIGSDEKGFSGSFDGGEFKISDLTINRPSSEYVGLFGLLRDAEVRNVHLDSVNIFGANATGGLTGQISNSRVLNSLVTGKVSGRTYTGGITGFNKGRIEHVRTRVTVSGKSYVGGITGINRGRILNSSAEAAVSGTGHNLGALVGNNYDGVISESHSSGSVNGDEASSVGGLSGSNGGIIVRSFSTADVNGRSYAGGLVGNNHSGEIRWSYSTGNVSGFNLVGGFAGVNRNQGIIEQSYTTGKTTGTIDAGGFIGVNRDPVKAGFWIVDSDSKQSLVSKGTTDGISRLSLDQTTGPESTKHMKGFSFNEIWGYVTDKTPQLLWTMPYFVISDVKGPSSVISGDLIELEVTLINKGSKPDTHSVVLNDGNDHELDRITDVALSPGEDSTFIMRWQTTVDDKGEFNLRFESQFYRKSVPLTIFRTPDIPELIRPFGLEEHISLTPAFRWEKAYLADRYQLQIAENENFSPVTFNITDIDTTTYTLKESLDYLHYYHLRVRGINDDEIGTWSKSSEFITIIERPEMVTLKTPVDEDNEVSTQPFFSWAETDRAENYTLQIATDEEFETVLFDSSFSARDSSLSFEDDLPSEKALFWRMQASNIGGDSDWSEIRSFSAVRKSSKKADFTNFEYKLEQNYPNPFNPVTYIQYSIPEATRVEIEVLNMLGQQVATLVDDYKSAGWHTVTFDASKLSSGFYIYRIKTKGFTTSRKLSLVK
ncbi:T9SS type A sorting domain-containing protein [Gracilimonas sp. BCB1]|uniref:T9SS type A sorting domain-containing protein n=1 Tax=Gracilimonas sp. BCB1 TaxID=3152362 RepID=UPI0032D924FD